MFVEMGCHRSTYHNLLIQYSFNAVLAFPT
jgi:hypothetical protein